MRDSRELHDDHPKSFTLACKVGQAISINEVDLGNLEDGEYDVVSERKVIKTRGQKVMYSTQLRLRRVS
jgi:hypothetical protein